MPPRSHAASVACAASVGIASGFPRYLDAVEGVCARYYAQPSAYRPQPLRALLLEAAESLPDVEWVESTAEVRAKLEARLADARRAEDARALGTMSRPVTMNDLFAEPDGCASESGADKLQKKIKQLDGMNTKSRVHIAKAAVQGEFGAKKFIKP